MGSTATGTFAFLTRAERRELLRLAREAIGAALGQSDPPTLQLSTVALLAPSGAFVTLDLLGTLRGCVGAVFPRDPLHLTVTGMARAAAFEDPRFSPLQAKEWERIDIEISRLSVPRPAHPEAIVPGVHGLCVIRGSCRGVFLPQVAARYRWDREQLLTETCRKAALPPDAWRDPDTELLVFDAEIFGERDLGARRDAPGAAPR